MNNPTAWFEKRGQKTINRRTVALTVARDYLSTSYIECILDVIYKINISKPNGYL